MTSKTDIKTHDQVSINGLKPRADFRPRNLQVLLDKGRSYVCAFNGTVGSREYFHIREVYEEYGELNPGKGVAIPIEKAGEFLRAISEYYTEGATKK